MLTHAFCGWAKRISSSRFGGIAVSSVTPTVTTRRCPPDGAWAAPGADAPTSAAETLIFTGRRPLGVGEAVAVGGRVVAVGGTVVAVAGTVVAVVVVAGTVVAVGLAVGLGVVVEVGTAVAVAVGVA